MLNGLNWTKSNDSRVINTFNFHFYFQLHWIKWALKLLLSAKKKTIIEKIIIQVRQWFYRQSINFRFSPATEWLGLVVQSENRLFSNCELFILEKSTKFDWTCLRIKWNFYQSWEIFSFRAEMTWFASDLHMKSLKMKTLHRWRNISLWNNEALAQGNFHASVNCQLNYACAWKWPSFLLLCVTKIYMWL